MKQLIIFSSILFNKQPFILQDELDQLAKRYHLIYVVLNEEIYVKRYLKIYAVLNFVQNHSRVNVIDALKLIPFSRFNIIAHVNSWLQWSYIQYCIRRSLSYVGSEACIIWFFHPNMYQALSWIETELKPGCILFDTFDIPPGKERHFIKDILYFHYNHCFTGFVYRKKDQLFAKVIPWRENRKERFRETIRTIEVALSNKE